MVKYIEHRYTQGPWVKGFILSSVYTSPSTTNAKCRAQNGTAQKCTHGIMAGIVSEHQVTCMVRMRVHRPEINGPKINVPPAHHKNHGKKKTPVGVQGTGGEVKRTESI